MRAVQWDAPKTLRLADLDEPSASEGQAVVAVTHCGICGSDLHSFTSGLAASPGQVLGHEFTGTIIEAPGVDALGPGDRVAVRPLIPCGECEPCQRGDTQVCEAGLTRSIGYGSNGAFAERVLVPRAIVGETVFPLPPSVTDRAGALVEPLAVSLHAVRLAEPRGDDVALVLGAGTIGLGAVRFLRLTGVKSVVVAEPSARRREAALALGADVALDPAADDVVAALRDMTHAGADAAIDCAGGGRTFLDALRAVRAGGRVVLCAVFGKTVDVRPDLIVGKELTVRGSMGYRDEFPDVIAALAAGDVDPDAFISHAFALADIEEAFRTQLDRDSSLKVLVTP
jgi:(R,R)-butanediol dehydrogenase/meso-butanediol dehydrogenase/diacetyl reductase